MVSLESNKVQRGHHIQKRCNDRYRKPFRLGNVCLAIGTTAKKARKTDPASWSWNRSMRSFGAQSGKWYSEKHRKAHILWKKSTKKKQIQVGKSMFFPTNICFFNHHEAIWKSHKHTQCTGGTIRAQQPSGRPRNGWGWSLTVKLSLGFLSSPP